MAHKGPKYRDDVTGRDEQDALMVSPELRAERQAQHLVELPDPKKPLKGRRRAPLVGIELLAVEFPRVLASDVLDALKAALEDKQPIFDQFTDHNHFVPSPEGVEAFVSAGNRHNTRLKTDKETDPNLIRANMRRQTQIQADRAVRGTYEDLNTARLRRSSIYVTRYQIETGSPLDHAAKTITSDAIVDFGNGLADKRQQDLLRQTGKEHLAETIIFIGETAQDDPTILGENIGLISIVQAEQIARCEYWRSRFEVADSYLQRPSTGGTRLTGTDLEDGLKLEQELQRLQSLVSNVDAI